jgi:hypothetical protein
MYPGEEPRGGLPYLMNVRDVLVMRYRNRI